MSDHEPTAPATSDARNLSKYMMIVSGQPYLKASGRLLWFRDDHPGGSIETDLIFHDGDEAIVKATIRCEDVLTGDGTIVARGALATAYGTETRVDFKDYVEKAETKAVNRALARLGYATPDDEQTPQFEQRAPSERAPQQAARTRPPKRDEQPATPPRAAMPSDPSNEGQHAAISGIAMRLGWDQMDLLKDMQVDYPDVKQISDLTFGEAGHYIAAIQKRQREATKQPAKEHY